MGVCTSCCDHRQKEKEVDINDFSRILNESKTPNPQTLSGQKRAKSGARYLSSQKPRLALTPSTDLSSLTPMGKHGYLQSGSNQDNEGNPLNIRNYYEIEEGQEGVSKTLDYGDDDIEVIQQNNQDQNDGKNKIWLQAEDLLREQQHYRQLLALTPDNIEVKPMPSICEDFDNELISDNMSSFPGVKLQELNSRQTPKISQGMLNSVYTQSLYDGNLSMRSGGSNHTEVIRIDTGRSHQSRDSFNSIRRVDDDAQSSYTNTSILRVQRFTNRRSENTSNISLRYNTGRGQNQNSDSQSGHGQSNHKRTRSGLGMHQDTQSDRATTPNLLSASYKPKSKIERSQMSNYQNSSYYSNTSIRKVDDTESRISHSQSQSSYMSIKRVNEDEQVIIDDESSVASKHQQLTSEVQLVIHEEDDGAFVSDHDEEIEVGDQDGENVESNQNVVFRQARLYLNGGMQSKNYLTQGIETIHEEDQPLNSYHSLGKDEVAQGQSQALLMSRDSNETAKLLLSTQNMQ